MWRNKSNGGWRCAVKAKARQHRDQNSPGYHVVRRKRELPRQRERILEQLANLRKEIP